MNFNSWLDIFISEADINLERVFEFTNTKGIWNYLPVSVVIEFIKQLPPNQKAKIKNTIVMIDFKNGNIYHYLEYLAKGISEVSS